MVITYCQKCGVERIFACPAEEKRRNKNELCRQCWKITRPKREKNIRWKGGKIKHNGYIMIYLPDHPYAKGNGYIREHRYIMEQLLDRYLLPTEVVHHINGIRTDNRIENLQLVVSNREHHKGHKLHPWMRQKTKCTECDKVAIVRGWCEQHYWQYFLKAHRQKNDYNRKQYQRKKLKKS